MHAFLRFLTAVFLAALVYCPRLAAQDEMLSTPAEYIAIDALDGTKPLPAKRGGQVTMALIAVQCKFSTDDAAVRDDRTLLERETKQPDSIAKANKLDAQPKPTATRQAAFPTTPRGKAESGEAVIEFLIDEQGHVRLPRIVSTSDPAFGDAAAQTMTG